MRSRDPWNPHAPPASLAPRPGEPIVHKSGFSTPDIAAFIEAILLLGRDTVVVAGVKTHACVRQLALDAWQAGLTVIVAADAVGSDDPLHAAATRRYFKARGIEFLSNGELNELFAGMQAKSAPRPRASVSRSRPRPPHRGHGVKRARRTRRADAPPCRRAVSRDRALRRANGRGARQAAQIRPARDKSVAAMLGALAARAAETSAAAANGADYADRRRPHGVVAAITPWNNPIYLPIGKIAPAVLYGNAVVWKPRQKRAPSRAG